MTSSVDSLWCCSESGIKKAVNLVRSFKEKVNDDQMRPCLQCSDALQCSSKWCCCASGISSRRTLQLSCDTHVRRPCGLQIFQFMAKYNGTVRIAFSSIIDSLVVSERTMVACATMVATMCFLTMMFNSAAEEVRIIMRRRAPNAT